MTKIKWFVEHDINQNLPSRVNPKDVDKDKETMFLVHGPVSDVTIHLSKPYYVNF